MMYESKITERIAQNVATVQDRIAAAAGRCGRTADDVTLVAVTKYVGEEETRALVDAGCRTLGESRPQHFVPKAEAMRGLDVRWHMIGHLQRNKIRRIAPIANMIESVDSVKLALAIDRIAKEMSINIPILLEANISGDKTKSGFEPDMIEGVIGELAECRNIKVCGMMGMASLLGGLDAARKNFERLRTLRDKLRTNCPTEIELNELSMGMSRDYEVAIEAGATIVRVGSALFEGVL